MAAVQWEEYIHRKSRTHCHPLQVSASQQEAYSKSHYGECSWTGGQAGGDHCKALLREVQVDVSTGTAPAAPQYPPPPASQSTQTHTGQKRGVNLGRMRQNQGG